MKLKNQENALHPKLQTIFLQQLNKAEKLLPLIEEDLQFDFRQKLDALREDEMVPVKKKWWKPFRPH